MMNSIADKQSPKILPSLYWLFSPKWKQDIIFVLLNSNLATHLFQNIGKISNMPP